MIESFVAILYYFGSTYTPRHEYKGMYVLCLTVMIYTAASQCMGYNYKFLLLYSYSSVVQLIFLSIAHDYSRRCFSWLFDEVAVSNDKYIQVISLKCSNLSVNPSLYLSFHPSIYLSNSVFYPSIHSSIINLFIIYHYFQPSILSY